jgi:hypothetical protein
MPATTADLFLFEDLEDVSRTSALARSDLDALRAVADRITSFIVRPNKDLGRAGPVCPFVPVSLARGTLWLAPEHVGGRSVAEVVDLVHGYQRRFLGAHPTDGDDEIYKAIVVVFTDLSPDRAAEFFDDVLRDLAVPSYLDDGFVLGGFYEGNEAGAISNARFRPFTSPVPFLLIRQAVIGDWKFFLDNEDWLTLWAHRYGASAAQALAEELRRLPWREAQPAPGSNNGGSVLATLVARSHPDALRTCPA